MPSSGTVTALLPAAGQGTRFGASENKVLQPLLGRPLLAWTLEAFTRCPEIGAVVLVGRDDELPQLQAVCRDYLDDLPWTVVGGGATRQESVARGLAAVTTELVLVHDAARCCIAPSLVQKCALAAREHHAMSLVHPVTDTLMQRTGEPVDRAALVAVETPQGFQTELLRRAHAAARAESFSGTDDLSLVVRLGHPVFLLESTEPNPKVTYPTDLVVARALLERQ